MNIDKDRLTRLNYIIEKAKPYCEDGKELVLPIGTISEFGFLWVSDLENVLSELETYKKIAEKLAEEVKRDSVFYDSKGISSCDLSEEKYCKCSKHNNGASCKQCIIDWARKEVEKDD